MYIYALRQSILNAESIYIYAHTGIHSLPGADTANKLLRKPLLIPTDVGNVSNQSKAPPIDLENVSAYYLVLFLHWQLR